MVLVSSAEELFGLNPAPMGGREKMEHNKSSSLKK